LANLATSHGGHPVRADAARVEVKEVRQIDGVGDRAERLRDVWVAGGLAPGLADVIPSE
jgi:hypothetical protein